MSLATKAILQNEVTFSPFWRVSSTLFEKIPGGDLNETQIMRARNTQTSKLQPKNRQDRACRIELVDLGLNFLSQNSSCYQRYVMNLLVLYTFIMYLDYHCFVYVVYVLFIALFHH